MGEIIGRSILAKMCIFDINAHGREGSSKANSVARNWDITSCQFWGNLVGVYILYPKLGIVKTVFTSRLSKSHALTWILMWVWTAIRNKNKEYKKNKERRGRDQGERNKYDIGTTEQIQSKKRSYR